MIPPHTNRYPKPPSGAATGWGRFFCWGERAAAGGCGGVKTPPYRAKDTWAVMARWRAGHARPLRGAPNGVPTRGAREGGSPPPLQWAGGCPKTGGNTQPVGTLQASQARPAPHCVGRLLRGQSPREKPSLTGEVAAKQAGGVQPVDGQHSKVAGRACPAPTGCHKWVADERGKGGRQPSPVAVGGGCRSLFTAFSTPCQTR